MNKACGFIILSLVVYPSVGYTDIERVSVSSSGEQGNHSSGLLRNRFNRASTVSADGRFVAFTSTASNLVSNDTNHDTNYYIGDDIFIHERDTGITERVSVSSSGEQGNRNSSSPSLSADGRYVAFSSNASNLVSGDTNHDSNYYFGDDVFVHDRTSGITERVSVNSNGEQGTNITPTRPQSNSVSLLPSISADGQFVAYVSTANNLVEGDTNDTGDIFVHDREKRTTERVSISSSGVESNGASGYPSISANGRFVAFSSTADNLVGGDTNEIGDIFVHDREAGITKRVSINSNGRQGHHDRFGSIESAISANGRFVAFTSRAANLVENDTNAGYDIFVHDRDTGNTERVNISSSGEQAYDDSYLKRHSYSPSLSADGRFVVFHSLADNLVDGDNNNYTDVFIHDRDTRITQLVSWPPSREQDKRSSEFPSISTDGRFISFESEASNLVLNDTNGREDIFVANNPLVSTNNDLIVVEKLINNEIRETQDKAAQLSTGTLYRQSYKVTNDSTDRTYQVQVFENGNHVCNFYALNPGQSRQRCDTFQTVLEGDQHVQVTVTAKVSGSGHTISNTTDAYYTGLTNVTGELVVTHRINNINADTADQAPTLGSQEASVFFKVENTGDIELYQVKTYHDPVSPVNSGWDLQCVMGPMKPGQVRYCKKDITLSESGLNQAVGRVQGRNALRSATNVINAFNPTYFIVP